MKFDVFEYTNQGGRAYNEDSVGHKISGESGIFVVADGLGGHQFGELASACVIDVLADGWKEEFHNEPAIWLKEQIAMANQKVLEYQKEKDTVLKSTVVALAIDAGKAVWANVGDSRLYYLHANEIVSVTNDHSVAFKKYKAGEITRDEMRTDEDQSCLLRAVGSADRSEPEVYDDNVMIESGDAFMLCSDGIWEFISDEEVLIDFLKSENAKQWAEHLLMRVMDRIMGGNDNLTILTLMVI